MADPNDPHNTGGIPQRPKNIDQAAQAFEQNQKAENEAARKVSREWEDRQDQRRADAQRQLDKTKDAPPAMRMYGQDRFINTDQGRNPDPARSKPLSEMSPAQQEMMKKLNAAREADRQQIAKSYDDKQYVKLPEKPQTGPAPPPPSKELTPAQQQMAEKMKAAREADRLAREQPSVKAPEKAPPYRSR